jgi:AcrR family transcriptional regulator
MSKMALLLSKQQTRKIVGKVSRESHRTRSFVNMATQLKSVDPRVRRTRQLLQQAMMELMQEKSISSISIQDITERATVNRATFYAHFEDKYALMDAILRDQFQIHVVDKLPPGYRWNKQSLHALILGVFEFLGEFHSRCSRAPQTSREQFEPQVERAIQQEIYRMLLNWLKQAPRTGAGLRIPVEITAGVMSWAIFGTAADWGRAERGPLAEDMANQVLSMLVEGVAGVSAGFA